MKAFNYFTIITLATLSVACNEKISPKLLDANQSTTVPPVIEPEEYFFRVKNTSPDFRKMHLHKTGIGNYDTPCEVKGYDKFSSGLFRDPARKPEFDITCIFNAEELVLNQKGFSFEFEASPNTCEFVGYSPFSFYNYKPGNSTGTYTQIICEEGATDADVASIPSSLRDANNSVVGCNKMIVNDAITPSTIALPFNTPADEQSLCTYDYSQNPKKAGPNCDMGVITINEVIYRYVAATEDEPARIEVDSKPSREIKCGGKVSACIQGPIKAEERYKDHTSMITLYETVQNETFKEKREYGEAPKNISNLFYVNFRRNLATPHADYGTQPLEPGDPIINYAESFREQRTYYPLLMENYAAGKSYQGILDIDGISQVDHIMQDDATFQPRIVRKGISYAAEPFLGFSDEETGENYRTSPYYTFYCLDSARETRARIKMVVRDWDRFFSTDRTKFELISDIYDLADGRIDNYLGVETPGDNDPINDLNDIPDWDDFIPMRRTLGPLDSVYTVWEPVRGFNNSNNFPQALIED